MEILTAIVINILLWVAGFVYGRHYGWKQGFETCKSIYAGTYEAPKRRGWLP